MNLGEDISFILKSAEELKEDEKPVSAPAPTQSDSEIKTNDTVNVALPELPPPSKSDGEKEEKTEDQPQEEKTAGESARDKAMELAARAGRPTSTGIVTGAGVGSLLAALGALHRSNSDNPSVLSHPALLGLLGAAGGYLGGNLLHNESKPTVQPVAPKGKSSLLPGALGALSSLGGTYYLGQNLAGKDRAYTEDFIEREFQKLEKSVAKKSVSKTTLKRYMNMREEYKKVLERQGYSEAAIKDMLGDKVKPGSNLKRQIYRSKFNPLNHVKALNPYKTLESLSVGDIKPKLTQSAKKLLELDDTGSSLLGRQLSKLLGVNELKNQFTAKNLKTVFTGIGTRKGGRMAKSLLKTLGSTQHLGPRLAALAAIAGTGALGANAISNAVSKD